MAGIRAEMKSFEEREKALENDMERVGGQNIQKMRQAVKAAVSRHSGIQKEISATKVKLRAAKKAIISCDEESGKFSKGIEDSEQAILAAKTQFELIEKEAATVLASFELAQKAQKEKAKEVETAETALASAKKEAEKVRGKMAELEGKLAELTAQLTELQNRREIWQSKLDQLRVKTWESTRELEEPSLESSENLLGSSLGNSSNSLGNSSNSVNNPTNDSPNNPSNNPSNNQSNPPNNPLDTETANRLRILPEVSEEELRGSEKGKVERSILRLEAERESLRKNVNLSAIAE